MLKLKSPRFTNSQRELVFSEESLFVHLNSSVKTPKQSRPSRKQAIFPFHILHPNQSTFFFSQNIVSPKHRWDKLLIIAAHVHCRLEAFSIWRYRRVCGVENNPKTSEWLLTARFNSLGSNCLHITPKSLDIKSNLNASLISFNKKLNNKHNPKATLVFWKLKRNPN